MKIKLYDLRTILFAANWQINVWKIKTHKKLEGWENAIKTIKEIENYINELDREETNITITKYYENNQ